MLAVNQQGKNPESLGRKGDMIVWNSEAPDGAKNIAIFNLGDLSAPYTLGLNDIGFERSATVRDLWQQTDLGEFDYALTFDVPAHGARLFKLTVA